MDICGNRRREVNIDRQHKCRLRINGASRRAANSTSADLSGQLGPKVAAVLLPCLHLERRIDGRIKNMPHLVVCRASTASKTGKLEGLGQTDDLVLAFVDEPHSTSRTSSWFTMLAMLMSA
jgi:hypothetical protein